MFNLCFQLEFSLLQLRLIDKSILYASSNTFIVEIDLFNWKVKKLLELKDISCFVCNKKMNIVVVGYNFGYIEVFNFETLSHIKTIKAHSRFINFLDISESKEKIVSWSSRKLKIWSISNFKLVKRYKRTYGISSMKIVNDYIYILEIEIPMQVYDLMKLNLQYNTQARGLLAGSLSISVKHGLIAYGCEQVHLYDFRTQTEKCCKFIGGPVSSLVFVECYVLCGTDEGKVFYLNCWDLDIRKCLKLQETAIMFVSSSKDLNKLVYSTDSKSFFFKL